MVELIEYMKPDFWSPDLKIPQPFPIYRVNTRRGRFYFSWPDRNLDPTIYISVTTLISKTLGTPDTLVKWIASNGISYATRYKRDAALYGTFMHNQILKLIDKGEYKFGDIESDLFIFLKKNRIDPAMETILWDRGDTYEKVFSSQMSSDMCAFLQFAIDVNLQPLAMEIVLASKKGFAGAIDLVAYVDIELLDYHGEVYLKGKFAGMPKKTKKKVRCLVIIDFKSGRKGFYETHILQLEAYRQAWNENFPEFKVDYCYNWSPADYSQDTPKYKFRNQTGKTTPEEFGHILGLAMLKKFKYLPIISGVDEGAVVKFKEPVFTHKKNIIKRYSLIDWVKKRHSQEIESNRVDYEKKDDEFKTLDEIINGSGRS